VSFRNAVLLLASATLIAVGLAGPAHAATAITVYSPQGTLFSSGSSVTVDGYNGSGGVGQLSVHCNQAPSRYPSVSSGSFSVPLGSYAGPDDCWISDDDTGDYLGSFSVSEPGDTVSDGAVNRATFYPLVRDDYQDSARFSWRQSSDARPTLSIVDTATGAVVRTATPYAYTGRNTWDWNGKDDLRQLVTEGRYNITVTLDGTSTSASVRVDSEIVAREFSVRKEGNQGVRFSTRGNCQAYRDSYEMVATLDCWGGRWARGKYVLSIPANAIDVRGTIDLVRSDADICCRGRITKGWSRTSKRSVAFWAQVSGWRATTINFVRVRYTADVRI
jgi:hypothetical protein